MNIRWSQMWSNFSFRSKGLAVWGDQALLLLLSNCIINMPHSLKWTIQSIVWINSRQIMAVLSCFALFLYRPDGRVSLQGYKKQENHKFTSSGAGTKCKTTASGIYSITAVDNAPTINLNGEKPDVIDRWPNCPNDYGEPNIADTGPKLARTMKNTTLLTRVIPMDLFTLEARMKCTCPWLSWDPQCTMASILLLAAQSLLNTFSHNDLLHVVAVISLLLQMSTNLYPKRAVDTFPLDLFYCLLFFSGALCTNPCRSE